MMTRKPDWISRKIVNEAIKITMEKRSELKNMMLKLCFEKYKEGKAAQIMYIGPYSEEGPAIKKIHNCIKLKGGNFDEHNLKHHEIYLNDPRRSKPENMKSIIRQPFI